MKKDPFKLGSAQKGSLGFFGTGCILTQGDVPLRYADDYAAFLNEKHR